MLWWSRTTPPPTVVTRADDRTRADDAFRRAWRGEVLAYAGDWHNARQLLGAMGRRLRPVRPRGTDVRAAFAAERETRRLESTVLARLAVPVGPGWSSSLARAPPLDAPLRAAFGTAPDVPSLMPLREILGAIGAWEWFRRGVPLPQLGGSVHPWYGVFAPVRSEYVSLFAQTLAARAGPLGLAGQAAFDLGTGTGVLAVLLARAGARVVATDVDPSAVGCARATAAQFGVASAMEVIEADLFPPGRARLVVANPPWIPGEPHGPLDRAVYDPGGSVLDRFLRGLGEHLDAHGEGWLILSDLAERLGLRMAGELDASVAAAGIRVTSIRTTAPTHPRARGPGRDARGGARLDLVAQARAAEQTRLYVLSSP